ncbi:MAG: hypothetical protein AAFQ87_19130, partial [Bacteroidota bacterium]
MQEVLWTMAFFIIGVNVYSMVRFWEAEGYPVSELIGDAITATIGGAVGGILLTVFHQSILHQNARRRSFQFLVLTETLADLRQELSVLTVEMQKLRRELSTTGSPNVVVGGDTLQRV